MELQNRRIEDFACTFHLAGKLRDLHAKKQKLPSQSWSKENFLMKISLMLLFSIQDEILIIAIKFYNKD